jgi:hypothetical protein
LYAKYSRELYNCTSADEKISILRDLKSKLSTRIPSFEEFRINFSELIYTDKITKDKKLVKYTLSKIHKYLANTRNEVVNYSMMSIEHLSSQSSDLYKTHKDKLIGKMGNLILVDENLNVKLGKKGFTEKKRILANSKITILDDYILGATNWDREQIDERTNLLAEMDYKQVFKI